MLSAAYNAEAVAVCTGQGAVLGWLLGLMKGAMEWATVPVLAVAMALPHGALVYWLSSSLCSLAQVVCGCI